MTIKASRPFTNLSMAELRAQCVLRGISPGRSAEITIGRLTCFDQGVEADLARQLATPEGQAAVNNAVLAVAIETPTERVRREEAAIGESPLAGAESKTHLTQHLNALSDYHGSPTGRAPSEPEMQTLAPRGIDFETASDTPFRNQPVDFADVEERAILQMTGWSKIGSEDGLQLGYVSPASQNTIICTSGLADAIFERDDVKPPHYDPGATIDFKGTKIIVVDDRSAMIRTLARFLPTELVENAAMQRYAEGDVSIIAGEQGGKSESMAERLFGLIGHLTRGFDVTRELFVGSARGLRKGAGIAEGSAFARGDSEKWLRKGKDRMVGNTRQKGEPAVMPVIGFFMQAEHDVPGYSRGGPRPANSYRCWRREDARARRHRLKPEMRETLRAEAASA